MPTNAQFDNARLPSPALPYDRLTKDLDDKPRIVAGTNVMSTLGGKLIKRPGVSTINSATHSMRADRLWLYETMESPAKVYVLASTYNAISTLWEMWYVRIDGAGTWTYMNNLRDLALSSRPHEVVVSRGLAYIKGFPLPLSTEKYGTVVFDGTTATTTLWGVAGPTTAARIGGSVTTLNGAITAAATSLTVATDLGVATSFVVSIGDEDLLVTAKGGGGNVNWTVTRAYNGTIASAHGNGAEVLYKDWVSSSHALTIQWGWWYTYAYKTATGHISNRAPFEKNPDLRPSFTGGFSDRRPKVDVQGTADTTNIPSIMVFRSLDGGDLTYSLETVTNTGAGTISYTDDQLAGQGGTLDPQPDELVDTAYPAPSLTSNNPPPTVTAPQVVGTDQPKPASPIARFAGRLWYWVNNILFYSGDEEIIEGIPEESWPTNNFFRASHLGANVCETKEALYAWTTHDLYWVRGTNKTSLVMDILAPGYGMPTEHPRARIAINNEVYWLTRDYRIAKVQGEKEPTIISMPLNRDIVTLVQAGAEIEFTHFSKFDKSLLIVNVVDKATPANTRQFVYDLNLSEVYKEPFWNPPWTIAATASVAGRIRENTTENFLLLYLWNGTTGRLVKWDETETVVQDNATNYGWDVTYNLLGTPMGNHINQLRAPSMATVAHAIILERTKFTSDTDPTVQYYIDDSFSTPTTTTAQDPPRVAQAKSGYVSKWHQVENAGTRIAVKISRAAANERAELQTVDYVFTPNSGA